MQENNQNFKVDFYKENGSKPVGNFIRGLTTTQKAAVVADLHLLEDFGNLAQYPLSRHLEDGIFEMRTSAEDVIIRILFFFDKGKIIVATNGFVKKVQKTPRSEIELAKKRREKYFKEQSHE